MTVDEVEALLDRLMDVVNQAGWGAMATYDIHEGYVTLVIDAVPTLIEETIVPPRALQNLRRPHREQP